MSTLTDRRLTALETAARDLRVTSSPLASPEALELFDAVPELVAEVRRLREQNGKLAEACRAAIREAEAWEWELPSALASVIDHDMRAALGITEGAAAPEVG